MKIFKACIIKLAILSISSSVFAIDLLNLDNYAEGASLPYGENLIVNMVETTGEKYIVGKSSGLGKLKFPVKLTGDFEVSFKVLEDYCCTEWFDFFLTAGEHQLNVTFYGGGNTKLTADSQSGGGDASNAFVEGKPNTFLLAVNNNVAKLYINDVFSQKVTLRPDLTYTQLVINGIENADAFYSLSINGNVSSNPTETPEETPEQTECTATYIPNTGRIVIPCISAPNEFGKTTLYSIQMQQQPNSFKFDLDLNTVQPR